MLTLESPRIIHTETYCDAGKWYLIVRFSDGGEDEYGPFDTENEAERFIF